LIAFNRNRKIKKLIPTKPEGDNIHVVGFEDENEEAQAVAQQINELTGKGVSLNEIAIFYRVNAQSRAMEEAFVRNKIPYQIVRGVEFYRRKEIRDLLAYLKVLVNPSDEISLMRIINTPARGIGKVTTGRISAHAVRHKITFFEALKNANHIDSLSKGTKAKLAVFVNMLEQLKEDVAGDVAPLAERVFAESGLQESLRTGGPDGLNALENVNELINSASEYDKQAEQPSLLDYLQQISLFSDADAYDAACDRAALMTLHAAKGLEFEYVFITGVEDGLLPHERSNTYEDEEQLEEERRLFFVGITRAKAGLCISYARYRTVRGQVIRTIPSQFLFELGTEFTEKARQDGYEIDNDYDDTSQITPHFQPGQLVRHSKFGLGRIKQFTDMGENSIVIVEFNSGQTKSLMIKYAGLTQVDI
jgi:DNA helicase-2/ATP-dependent DNA helicase PcrA